MDTAANIKEWIGDLFEGAVPSVHPMDVVEIIIIAIFFYYILVWIKNTRAWMLLRGILVVVVFFIIAGILQMSTILWLGDKLLSVVLVAIVVVFQPELRHALETIGRDEPPEEPDYHGIRKEPRRPLLGQDRDRACPGFL